MFCIGALLKAQGELAKAESTLRDVVEGYREQLGAEHPNTRNATSWLRGVLKAKASTVQVLLKVENATHTFEGIPPHARVQRRAHLTRRLLDRAANSACRRALPEQQSALKAMMRQFLTDKAQGRHPTR